jgi:hypothetical protein
MSPTAVPSRITIDFRDAALPSRTWILGVDEAATARMELIAFEEPPRVEVPPGRSTAARVPASAGVPAGVTPSALTADCVCPEFCERDHANE